MLLSNHVNQCSCLSLRPWNRFKYLASLHHRAESSDHVIIWIRIQMKYWILVEIRIQPGIRTTLTIDRSSVFLDQYQSEAYLGVDSDPQ